MRLGYNTNGLAHHRLDDALCLVAELGYESVALTIDHGALAPREDRSEIARIRRLLTDQNLASVVETGARFLLDPARKHHPTLVSGDAGERTRRVDFLKWAIDVATELGSDAVSLWSGVVHDEGDEAEIWTRLEESLAAVCLYAEAKQVDIGFEPEPGMFIDTMDQFAALQQRINSPRLKLTLDVGHLHCLGETPIPNVIEEWKSELVNIHIEDMVGGVHNHLMFGEGEMDFPPIMNALRQAAYDGGVHVELSRHSHMGPTAARQAYEFLQPLVS